MTASLEDLLAQVRHQQDEVARIQQGIETTRISGSSRSGEVTVTLLGSGRVTDVTIDPDSYRRFGPRELGEIVCEAVNDGLTRLAETTRARFAPLMSPDPAAPSAEDGWS